VLNYETRILLYALIAKNILLVFLKKECASRALEAHSLIMKGLQKIKKKKNRRIFDG